MTPNTQGASWEEFDRLVKECENTAYLVSEESHPQSENDLARENLKAYFSKERAEGERRGRGKEYLRFRVALEKTLNTEQIENVLGALATLPADSTEKH